MRMVGQKIRTVIRTLQVTGIIPREDKASMMTVVIALTITEAMIAVIARFTYRFLLLRQARLCSVALRVRLMDDITRWCRYSSFAFPSSCNPLFMATSTRSSLSIMAASSPDAMKSCTHITLQNRMSSAAPVPIHKGSVMAISIRVIFSVARKAVSAMNTVMMKPASV